MMGWELNDLQLSANGRTASAFQFEIAVQNEAQDDGCAISGDGVVFHDGRVWYNREKELKHIISSTGLDAEGCLSGLSCHIVQHALSESSVA